MNFRKRNAKAPTPATSVVTTSEGAPVDIQEPPGLPKPAYRGGISDAAMENFSNVRTADKSNDATLRNLFPSHPGF